jgi:hypothetical protein
MATAPPKKTRDLLDQQQAPYQQRFHVTTVTRYLMVSVTSTLHFRDTLHFTITTTTTTTMTTPTTKPPRPPPRAQTRPPPLQEQTGLETQLRLESQVYFFCFFFVFFFCITNIYLQCVRYASHDDDNRRPPPSTYEGPNDGLPSFGP